MRYFLYAFKYWLAAGLFMFVVIALMEFNTALAGTFISLLISLFLVWRLIKAALGIRGLTYEVRRYLSGSALFGNQRAAR